MQMHQCMQKFAKMTIPQLMDYGFPTAKKAEALIMMSRNLLQYGFEESIKLAPKRISYRNQPKEGYPLQEPCCILELPQVRPRLSPLSPKGGSWGPCVRWRGWSVLSRAQ